MTEITIKQAATEAEWAQMKILLAELLNFEKSLRPQRKETDDIIDGAFAYVREHIAAQNGACIVAGTADGTIIGFMNGWIENGDGLDRGDNRLATISDAYIRPGFRNGFLFKRMARAMQAHFKAAGVTRLAFDTLAGNRRMQALCLRLGYVPHKVIFELAWPGSAPDSG